MWLTAMFVVHAVNACSLFLKWHHIPHTQMSEFVGCTSHATEYDEIKSLRPVPVFQLSSFSQCDTQSTDTGNWEKWFSWLIGGSLRENTVQQLSVCCTNWGSTPHFGDLLGVRLKSVGFVVQTPHFIFNRFLLGEEPQAGEEPMHLETKPDEFPERLTLIFRGDFMA